MRKVETCKYAIRPEIPYERKNGYVESSIENAMVFFKPCDLKSWNNVGANFDDIRTKVLKNEAKISR